MTRRTLILALGALVLAWRADGAEPVVASEAAPAVIPLGAAPQAAGKRVGVVVTMLAAAGPPAAAVVSLRGADGITRPLGQMAPYPATFDSAAGDPAQQTQFDVTAILREHPGELRWAVEIRLQPLTPHAGSSASTQRFTAAFAVAP